MLAGCGIDLKLSAQASYDEVLAAIDRTEPELGGGSNHAPMAADALAAGGRGDLVAPWVERYGARLQFASLTGAAIDLAARPAALGDYSRRFDWVATFAAELQSSTPAQVFAQAWPLLGPGFFAAGWHGFLRAAHAFRAVQREDTPARRLELAHGLGFWAARHEVLPGAPGASPQSGLTVAQALAQVPLVPNASRVPNGLISEQVQAVKKLGAFAASVEAVDFAAHPPADALTELVAAAARLYVNDGSNDIVLLHGITGSAAVRLVWPALDEASQREALGYAFRAVAAAYAVKAKGPSAFDAVASPKHSADVLLERGLTREDEHDLKLAEACVRESRLGAPAEVLSAAERRLAL